jgi:type IX secretion system PorP/SprF family membrane protein
MMRIINSMKNIKYILLAFVLIYNAAAIKAQQDPMYTHYMYNTLAINPAYAGSRDALSIMGLGRFQWVGLNGAPMSQTFQVHTPIWGGLAAGVSLGNESIGPVTNTNINMDLAYHFYFAQHSRLAIGMRYSTSFFNNRLTSLTTENPNDPTFANNYNITLGNVGAGIYYQHTKFYVGFSIPNLVEHNLNNTGGVSTERRHYYAIAGGYFKVARTVDLKPSGLVKIVQGAPVQVDLTLEAIFAKKVSVGVFGRLFDGVGVLLGYNIMPNFRIGYAFDWPITEVMKTNMYGSHEVMLRYDLSWGKYAKVNNPRYF